MLRHNFFSFFFNSVKTWLVLCCDRAKISRHKNVMFKCNYVATKRKIAATNNLCAIPEFKTNFVVTDRKIVATKFVQFISHDVTTMKNIVATHFVLL